MLLTIKLGTYPKLNGLKQNCFCIKIDLALDNQEKLICHKTQRNKHRLNTDPYLGHVCTLCHFLLELLKFLSHDKIIMHEVTFVIYVYV